MPGQMAPEPPAIMVHAASEFTYELGEHFIPYARIDMHRNEKSTTSSTEKQYQLLRLLVDELTEMNTGGSFEAVGYSKQDPLCQPGHKVQVSDGETARG